MRIGPSRSARPVQKPESFDDEDALNAAPADDAFLTGNGLANRCSYVLNYGQPHFESRGLEGWFFCRTNYLEWFFEHDAPKDDFVLVTHNSDWPVGERHRRHLRSRRLRAWFATNVDLAHPKLHPIPLGIANPHWPHGKTEALRSASAAAASKSELFDVSFSLETNAAERRYCLEQTGLEPARMLPFPDYLDRLASSWFSVSPAGHGVDCHRTWEALYVGTIPVVLRSPLTEAHPELPLVVLDDWSEFGAVGFSPALYRTIWGDWRSESIALDTYLHRMERLAPRGAGRS
jgi:hypothetical protein